MLWPATRRWKSATATNLWMKVRHGWKVADEATPWWYGLATLLTFKFCFTCAMMFHSIGALSPLILAYQGFAFFAITSLELPPILAVSITVRLRMVVLTGIHTKTRIPFRHQQLLLKRTTFRLAYAGHLQVFKEENVQLRDLMYTMMMGGSQVLHNWCFGCTCTNIDYWNACICHI